MKSYLEKLMNRESLTLEEMKQAAATSFSEQTTESELASFLTALRVKGETPEEIAGLAEIIRSQSAQTTDIPIPLWIIAAQVVMVPTVSISAQQPHLSWPAQEPLSPNTATAASQVEREARMCWSTWAFPYPSLKNMSRRCLRKTILHFCLRQMYTPP